VLSRPSRLRLLSWRLLSWRSRLLRGRHRCLTVGIGPQRSLGLLRSRLCSSWRLSAWRLGDRRHCVASGRRTTGQSPRGDDVTSGFPLARRSAPYATPTVVGSDPRLPESDQRRNKTPTQLRRISWLGSFLAWHVPCTRAGMLSQRGDEQPMHRHPPGPSVGPDPLSGTPYRVVGRFSGAERHGNARASHRRAPTLR
jgi:hypothetical protein